MNSIKLLRPFGLFAAYMTFAALIGNPAQVHAASSYASAVLADNPLGYWRLGEQSGLVAFDLSSNGLNGNYNGGVQLNQPGAIASDSDKSISLDGDSSYVSVAADANLNQLVNDFTIEAWVRTNPSTHSFRVVSTRSFEPPSQRGYSFSIESSQELWFTAFAVQDYPSGVTIPLSEWTHVAVTFDTTNTARFYVNGSLQSTVTGWAPALPNGSPFNIGREPIESAPGVQSYFGGGLDEVAIYGRALTGAEISRHYSASVPEPSGAALGFLSCIGLIAWRWRRASRTSDAVHALGVCR